MYDIRTTSRMLHVTTCDHECHAPIESNNDTWVGRLCVACRAMYHSLLQQAMR